MKRRDFLKKSAIVTTASALVACDVKVDFENVSSYKKGGLPIVISTWNHGIAANKVAMDIIKNGGNAMITSSNHQNGTERMAEVISKKNDFDQPLPLWQPPFREQYTVSLCRQ